MRQYLKIKEGIDGDPDGKSLSGFFLCKRQIIGVLYISELCKRQIIGVYVIAS